MDIAIVTGASAGLGVEFVKQLDQTYPSLDEIWMVARRKEPMEALEQTLGNAKGRIFTIDLSKKNEREILYQTLEKDHPTIRFLVNSAGYGKIGTFIEVDLEEQLGMIDLNISALVELTHKSIPYMKKGSKIIQVASSAAFMPMPEFAVYAATKSFVRNFSKALAIEVKQKGIDVMAICPGPVRTEFFKVASKKGKPIEWKERFMAEPEEVAKKAILDMERRKLESIYGVPMKIAHGCTKIIPSRWILSIYGKKLK